MDKNVLKRIVKKIQSNFGKYIVSYEKLELIKSRFPSWFQQYSEYNKNDYFYEMNGKDYYEIMNNYYRWHSKSKSKGIDFIYEKDGNMYVECSLLEHDKAYELRNFLMFISNQDKKVIEKYGVVSIKLTYKDVDFNEFLKKYLKCLNAVTINKIENIGITDDLNEVFNVEVYVNYREYISLLRMRYNKLDWLKDFQEI